jgi:hypothetical protein
MSKPGWIRFLGWLSLALLVTPVCIPLAEMLSGQRIPRTVIPGLMLVAFFPCFIVWLLASIVHHIVRWSARARAEALAKQFPGGLAGAALSKPGVDAPPSATPPQWGGERHLVPRVEERK